MTEDYMEQSCGEVDHLAEHDDDDMFVWPWKGIIVNLPVELIDGRYVGKSGSNMRDELAARGFNPTRVHPLWNSHGHSGSAVVEFRNEMLGFYKAKSFENAYEADHHGKKDWNIDNNPKSGIYGWVARREDYRSNNIIGEHLRKIADLKTLSDIQKEEDQKANKLESYLTNVNEVKKREYEETNSKYVETENALRKLMAENDKIHQSYNEEIEKMQSSVRAHVQKVCNDHVKRKLKIESEKRELELQGIELQKREIAARNSSLGIASDEQRKAEENMLKLADNHKREKEKLHEKIIVSRKQVEAKHAAELEVKRLKGRLNVLKHMGDDNLEVMKKIEEIHKKLKEKEEELEYLVSLNQMLVVQQRKNNDELQEARKELIERSEDAVNLKKKFLDEGGGNSSVSVKNAGDDSE
ncbi:hypothetical protein L1987_11560 [Smallanthus sonchifolius]|uniref:Uncharacterized protein n=1 Tax=Smallanthus sonchifolius TaxID=185202 RepID=A0ACB9JBM8_9ASTR|nr:hypothetical protein L1987_11560 [Smallanthus sonchifolius]